YVLAYSMNLSHNLETGSPTLILFVKYSYNDFEINVKNRIDSKKISNRGYAYKRAYKKVQDILYQKMGNTYKIYHRDWLSFEDFK
ncbi:8052_t:CDS:2, partial [Racocetra persica]